MAGDPNPDVFDRQRLPEFLQHAAYFLFEQRLRFPLQSRDDLNANLARAGYSASAVFSHETATKVCAETGVSHLLAGSANFRPADGLIVNIVSYSCRRSGVIAKGRASGRLSDLQRLLATGLREASPFARALAPAGPSGADPRALDLAVVIDTSGSMATDLPQIRKGLASVRRQAPEGSRIGTVFLDDGDRIDVLPFTRRWDRMLQVLSARRPAGNVSATGLERGLERIEQYRDTRGIPRLLVFSDAPAQGRRLQLVESRLRRLKRRGWDVHLFQLAGQRPEDRGEWQRLARAVGLKSPEVIYGRRAGFVEFSLFLVMIGSRFYQSDRDLSGPVAAGSVEGRPMTPIETVAFPADALTLDELPRRMAARDNRKLSGLGPVVSGLEAKITKSALGGTLFETVPYRALVKHEGRGFWVRLHRRTDFERLKALRGQSVYLGLRMTSTPGAERITNLPGEIFIRKQKDVPRLLINRRAHLQRLPQKFISPADVWFFLSEIIEVRDARREQDIRE